MGEDRQFTVLRQIQTEFARHLLGGFALSGRTDARDRLTDVHRRTDAFVKQIGLQKNLSVGDGNNVGRNGRRNISGLRFDDRQSGASRRRTFRPNALRARAGGSGDRTRHPDTLRGPADGAARVRSGDTPVHVWTDRHGHTGHPALIHEILTHRRPGKGAI